MAEMKGWQAVVQALKAERIKHVFGMPSNPNDLYDALYDTPEIRPIQVRHEGAGCAMALGYTLASGEPAVCFAGAGPGVANLAPMVLEALATCAPVIVLASVTDRHITGKGAFQETDQIGMMQPLTKWAVSVPYGEKIPWIMRRAFYLATNGQPGPVYVELPYDIGRTQSEIPAYIPAQRAIRTTGEPGRIQQAVKLLANAERPLIVAGGGARRSGAHAQLKELAEKLGMPVMTTPSGRGIIPEDHPLAIGQVGLYRTRLGMQAFREADLVITIGSRNEEFQTGGWEIFPLGAKLIQIDIESFEIGRNWIPDLPILGDAKLVLSAILEGIEKLKKPAWENRRRVWERSKRDYLVEIEKECLSDDVPIKTKRVVYEINRVFDRDTILVNENGSQDLWTYYSPYYRVLDKDGCVAPGEQTCMGIGVMGAVGVKLARPEMNVVCVTGDAAFQMYNQDVPSAVQNNAAVTWIILNNFSMGWIKYIQKDMGGRHIAVDFTVQPDFVKMAEAYQCYGERVDLPDQVVGALTRARQANEQGTPAILEIIIDSKDLPEGFHEYHKLKKPPNTLQEKEKP
jgi:acetolactate synthase-1/2/3 large subunit